VESSQGPESGPQGRASGPTVLFVHDGREHLAALEDSLRLQRVGFNRVRNCREAHAALERPSVPLVVFTDTKFPDGTFEDSWAWPPGRGRPSTSWWPRRSATSACTRRPWNTGPSTSSRPTSSPGSSGSSSRPPPATPRRGVPRRQRGRVRPGRPPESFNGQAHTLSRIQHGGPSVAGVLSGWCYRLHTVADAQRRNRGKVLQTESGRGPTWELT
jgi:hypothetical protein